MDSKHLYFLSETIRYGSMSRAAEHLGIAQSTLSRIIQTVEDRVGAPVVQRGRYGITPTEIGEELSGIGREIGHLGSEGDAAIERWRAGFSGQLRIGVGPMLTLSVMPMFLSKSLKRKSAYSYHVISAAAVRLVDRLNNGQLDVALAPQQLNLHQEALIQEVIFEDEMAVFAGQKSPLLHRSGTIASEELRDGNWIQVGIQSGIFGTAREVFERLGLTDLSIKLSFSGDIAIALELLRSSDILVALPKRLTLLCPGIRPNQLVTLNTELPKRNLAVWTTKKAQYRPEILDFRKNISRFFAALS